MEGTHNDTYSRPELTQDFLRVNLLQQSAAGCPRKGR